MNRSRNHAQALEKKDRVSHYIVIDDGKHVLTQILCLYILRTRICTKVTLIDFGYDNDDQVFIFSEPILTMLNQLGLWSSKLEFYTTSIEQVIIEAFDILQTTPTQHNSRVFSASKHDFMRFIDPEFQSCVQCGDIQHISLNVAHLDKFEILDDTFIDDSLHVNKKVTCSCCYQYTSDKEKKCLESDAIICLSMLLSSHNTIGKSTSMNRFGLDHFYEQFYVDWKPLFLSSCITNNNMNNFSQFENKHAGDTVAKAEAFQDPNLDFIADASLVPYQSLQPRQEDRIVPVSYPVVDQTTHSPPSIFSSFSPKLFSKENNDYMNQQSLSDTIPPYVRVLRSSDKSTLGTFVPLPMGEKGVLTISNQFEYGAHQMKEIFPLSEAATFRAGQVKYTSSVRQIADIFCRRKIMNSSVFAFGECKHGNMIHPMLRFNAFAHEIYYFLVLMILKSQNETDWNDKLEIFESETEQFFAMLNKFSDTLLNMSWASSIKNYASSKLSRITRSVASWLTSNEMKATLSLLGNSNLQSSESVNEISLETLFAMNSWIYNDQFQARLWKERNVDEVNQRKMNRTSPESVPANSVPMVRNTRSQNSNTNYRQKKKASDSPTLSREEKQSRRIQVFLNQIFPTRMNNGA